MVENVPPGQVWEALRRDPKAQLVDVRTDAEWSFVGLPDLSSLGKQVVPIQWQLYPTMVRNTAFTDQLREAGFAPDHHIYFICRGGGGAIRRIPARLQCGRRVRGQCRCVRSSRRDGWLESQRSALAAAIGL